MSLTNRQKQLLLGSFLFEQIPPQLVEGFLDELHAESFAAGAEIYTASAFARSVGFVTKGAAVVHNASGVLLNTLDAGNCFGVAALFSPEEDYIATVSAKTAAQVVFITDRQLTGLFAEFPQTAVNYIAFLSCRIRFLNRKIERFTAPSALEALRFYLLENEQEGTVVVSQGYAQLARQLDIGRASLYRSLDVLEKRGIIRRAEKTVAVRIPAALKHPF